MALRVARVNEGSHSFTCHPYPQVAWAILNLLPSRWGWHSIIAIWLYSFLVRRRVGGWVGLVAGSIPRSFARPKTVTYPSTSRGGREWNSRPSSYVTGSSRVWAKEQTFQASSSLYNRRRPSHVATVISIRAFTNVQLSLHKYKFWKKRTKKKQSIINQTSKWLFLLTI